MDKTQYLYIDGETTNLKQENSETIKKCKSCNYVRLYPKKEWTKKQEE